MKKEMVSRAAHVYSMPLAEGVSILHPELAVVKFGLANTVDIGILCYAQRTNSDKNTRSSGREVVLESLLQSRIPYVRKLLFHISALCETSGLRMRTLQDRFGYLVGFVNWADFNKWPDVLSGVDAAGPAMRAYFEYVRDRVTRNAITLNTGARLQINVVNTLGGFFDAEHIGRGLNLLKRDRNSGEATLPPSELDQGRVLSLCNCLFDGICELVVDQMQYPYALKTPKYLGFPKDQLWVFPAKAWFKTPAAIESSPMHAGYDYVEGRLATRDEVKTQYSRVNAPKEVIWGARTTLKHANENFNHSYRWHLSRKALNIFLIMFIAATGMSWAQAAELPWSGDYEVHSTNQGFRAVKWRAGGRSVSFELSISFLPKFKRFLTLRNYILQGKQCDYLFFNSLKVADNPGRIRSSLERTYEMLRGIDPALNAVMPRAWRAAKSDWLVRNTDPSTAALVLQNSEKTVLKHYAQGSETLHHEEMSKFLSSVAVTVIAPGEALEGATPCAVGACTSFGEPVAASAEARIKPNCDSAEGCLFCDKFRVHADETDTRKLLSCRYTINLTSPLISTDEEFGVLILPILERIDGLVADIAGRKPAMVERLKEEVNEDGELDPYWAGKVEMLMTLGLI